MTQDIPKKFQVREREEKREVYIRLISGIISFKDWGQVESV